MRLEKLQYRDSSAARTILRFGALTAPLSMVAYELLLRAEVLPTVDGHAPPSLMIILTLTIGWAIIGGTTFLTKQPKRLVKVLEVVSYFILAILQTWLISGVISPFSAYWVMLLTATYLLLGKNGLKVGSVAFIFTLAIDALVLKQGEIASIILNLLTATAILATSLVIAAIMARQRTSYLELTASQIREENERNQNLTLINNFTDSVFSTDHNGIIVSFNSAALSLLDTNHSIESKYVSDVVQLETEEGKRVDVFKEMTTSGLIRHRDDLVMRLPDDDLLRLEITFAPVLSNSNESNDPDNYVLILRDVTRIKSLEEERDEFISVVSHELRTPVAIAEGALSNAALMAARDKQSDIEKTVSEAHKQILFLARMVNDLSTFSRAESGIPDEPELINPTDLAHQLYKQYSPHAEGKSLKLNLNIVGKPGNVHTSRLYLQELLQNLVTNAIKYTEKGSVTMHIEQVGNHVNFAIIDTGIGIGKSDLGRIFSRFYRAEDYRTRETNGTGLWLYVSSKLAKKLGCEIEVKSRLNHGSTFSFSLIVTKK